MLQCCNLILPILQVDGKMIMVGIPAESIPLNFSPLVYKRRTLSGSLIGGIKQTQEMLDFCGKHNVVCDIEMVQPDGIDAAWERVVKSQVKYRAVIDMRHV
jgi:alcohol dehydrogenase (NADP+)